MSAEIQPPCQTDPSPCHEAYVKLGGKTPCPLLDLNMCRVVNNYSTRIKNRRSEDVSKRMSKVEAHSSCPISLFFTSPQNEDEALMHEHFRFIVEGSLYKK